MEYDLDVADIRWIRSHAKYGTRAEGKYAMRLETPAACKQEHHDAAKAELDALSVPMQHDEL